MAKNSKKNKDKDNDNLTPILDEPTGPDFDDSSQDQTDIADAIEQAKNDGWNQDTQSFFERNKGTIFPFIIFVVIILVGIGAWTLLLNNDDSDSGEQSDVTQDQDVDKEDEDTEDTDQDTDKDQDNDTDQTCLLYTSPSPRD